MAAFEDDARGIATADAAEALVSDRLLSA